MKEMFDLTGKKAIVTFGASGYPKAIAEAIHDAGGEVVIMDMDKSGKNAAAEIGRVGAAAYFVETDFSDRNAVPDGFKKAFDLLGGKIDILVNGCGAIVKKAAAELTDEDYDKCLNLDLVSTFLMTQQAAREMVKAGCGHVINVASVFSSKSGVKTAAYDTMMGAVCQVAKAFSNELACKGLRANTIAVGFSEENMGIFAGSGSDADKVRSDAMGRIPVKRLGRFDDVKGLALLLCSEASDYITGTVIPLDGGYLAV